MRSRHPFRRATALALVAAVTVLTGCSGGGSDDAPRGWIADTYQRGSGSGVYLDPVDRPGIVADEIDGQSSAEDRITSDDQVFLKYDDDIVAISPNSPRGSRIEIEDYRRGVQRWHNHVGHRWSSSQNDNFRGGGPGSGK
ncbi:DUF4247 domain-containing protein [Streptomyces triticirhizae]|uniref:DUF4247 domain-containing protein n=1 Tax=Streptomyces triticirhizae TaxID=2483353 RepID=UPI001F21471E|nr:DUF4247 domain-containing protein [Streptomyces triticirhizae]